MTFQFPYPYSTGFLVTLSGDAFILRLHPAAGFIDKLFPAMLKKTHLCSSD
jgi:hypothetical protein